MAKLPQSSFALDFLRRLLCAHTAPGGDNAARRYDDADAAALLREKAYEGASPARSPCIVARLMGLDAMPTPARDQQPQTQTLRRSRSASSAEGLSPPPPTPCCSPRPRVARTTSASFGDRPTYLRRENDEFLLLSFSPDDDAGDDLSAGFSSASTIDADAVIARRKQRRRRRHGEPGRSRRQAAKAEECGTENSSPVSVLDAQEESSTTTTTTSSSSSSSSTEEAEQCSPTSDGEEIRPAPRQEQGSRGKLPEHPFEDLGGRLRPEVVSTCRVSDYSGRDRKAVNNGEVVAPAATGIWRTICRLVEDDICGMKWGGRDDANIAAEMESAILEQLICEETEELVHLTVV